jgi:hypothetical protein
VTCDNASNNDVMIRELAELVPGFEGEVSHTRCFLHVINLVAKSLIHQFDTHGSQTDIDDEQQEHTDEPEVPEDSPSEAAATDESDDEDAATDNDDGFVDEVEKMDEDEKELHECLIIPVKVVLVKVSIVVRVQTLCLTLNLASKNLLQDH